MVLYTFVSSTFLDLGTERAMLQRALSELSVSLRSLGITLVAIDLSHGANPRPPLEHCLHEVDRCDLMLLLVGQRYGSVTEDGLSITESEYDRACDSKKPVLVYIKCSGRPDAKLAEERGEANAERLRVFKSRLQENHTRQEFSSPEELRGSVFRDVLRHVLEQHIGLDHTGYLQSPAVARKALECLTWLREGNVSGVIERVRQVDFRQELRRYGMHAIQKQILVELLDLQTWDGPHHRVPEKIRAELLMEFVRDYPSSSFVPVAQAELDRLEQLHVNPRYCFELSRFRAEELFRMNVPHMAKPFLQQMRRKGREIGEAHTLAELESTFGNYYRSIGKRRKAFRKYEETIAHLMRMDRVCPYCLAQAMINLGLESVRLQLCEFALLNFARAFYVAQAIDDRDHQSLAMLGLAEHFELHNAIKTALAAFIWMSRIQRKVDPTDENSDEEVAIGPIVRRYGVQRIKPLLENVWTNAESIVTEAIEHLGAVEFVTKLHIEQTSVCERSSHEREEP